eukprot:gnl/MRDRNA2_/MRDRNA2_33845_c0_seq2.p1 gnl/MRDRNA2_/MRDRNA2_33845_c0~~gnl/MRDRNA2_/MRDRNA2_33845_c0_seq2.p1  ORF type:complete len:352 (-),score=47.00 gnl/MRDRNA2_/MRDRNA2_33845_c0_seq2:67-1041(-)
MAIQHLVAFSSNVQGAAIAAGSPYGCGALPLGHEPVSRCYYGPVNVQFTVEYLRQRYSDGLIDDPVNLKSTPVVVFNGKNDWTVWLSVARATVKQLEKFIDPEKVTAVLNTSAAHVWSVDHGHCKCGACTYTGSDLCCDVNNCGYDLSGDMLRRFYGPNLKPRIIAKRNLASMNWIEQLPYVPAHGDWSRHGMSRWALAYVPTGCRHNSQLCRIHVDYHGCIDKDWPERQQWAAKIDLIQYGEANDIIILYPQAAGTHAAGVGCWNWGFTGDDKYFDTRKSVQLLTVQNLIADLDKALLTAIELPIGAGPPPDVVETNVTLIQV